MCTRTRSASRYANLRRDDVRAQPEASIRGRLKMRDMKMRDQIAGVENAGKVSMENQSVKMSQSSCICVQSYSFSISLLDK